MCRPHICYVHIVYHNFIRAYVINIASTTVDDYIIFFIILIKLNIVAHSHSPAVISHDSVYEACFDLIELNSPYRVTDSKPSPPIFYRKGFGGVEENSD